MNNRRHAGHIQLAFTFAIICILTLWICSISIEILKIASLQWTSGIVALFIFFYFSSGGFYYIELEKPDDHFEIKFYNSFPFSREFKMFRIPINSFIKYEVSGSKVFRRKLTLFQMSASQLAKYPPIFITSFSRKNILDLEIFFKELKK